MTLEHAYHVGELIVIALTCWRAIAAFNRFTTLFKDFPPHRHLPGNIINYPAGYEPSKFEKMNGSTALNS